jgi:hypothetical protein
VSKASLLEKGSEQGLSELAEAFSRFRSANVGHRAFPQELRRMAVDVAREKGSLQRVATACGVSKQSIHTWIHSMPPPARRLTVAAEEVTSTSEEVDIEKPKRREASAPASVVPLEVEALMKPFLFRIGAGVSLEASPAQALWLVRSLGGNA